MKRILSVVIVITLLGAIGGPAVATSEFADVPSDAWYAKYIDVCVEAGLLEGVGGGRFAPDAALSYAEMLTVCARLHNKLTGGDGSIPKQPEGGVKDLVYFTDSEGNKVANFADLQGWGINGSPSSDGYYFPVYFEEDVMARLHGEEAPLDELIMVCIFDGEVRLDGEYFTHDDVTGNRPDSGYSFFVPGELDIDLYAELIEIDFFDDFVSEYDGKWYADTMRYWERIASDYTPAEVEELEEYLEQDNPALYDPDIEDDCVRVFLALFIMISLPEGYLTPIKDVPEIPDMDMSFIRALYSAGIFGGVDEQGSFDGYGTLTRAQLAAVIARVLDPELRIK